VPTNHLLAFYRRQSRDDRGRTLDDVRAFGSGELERVHDYIQWLFPLAERSGANPTAPVLTPDAITAFREDGALRRELLESFAVMLQFYGFRLEHDPIRIERAANFDERRVEWLRSGNHNFLRLTRIMRSLTVLGLPDHARALLDQLEQVYTEHPRTVGDLTIGHWRHAVS
jgi:hypothetical protein